MGSRLPVLRLAGQAFVRRNVQQPLNGALTNRARPRQTRSFFIGNSDIKGVPRGVIEPVVLPVNRKKCAYVIPNLGDPNDIDWMAERLKMGYR
jgi:hypothetical protein